MPKNVIFSTLITGVYDVNRTTTLPNNDYSLIEKWANSIINLKLQGVIFHNSFSDETIAKYSNEFIKFERVEYNKAYNLSVFRYFVYLEYLKYNHQNIDSLFITDSTDVEVINNPFEQPLFKENTSALFCGDEPTILLNEWMINHSTHFRNQIPEFEAYEQKYANQILLNCGIIGGSKNTMLLLLQKLTAFHQQYNQFNKTNYTGDMGAFNFIVHNYFNENLFHGSPVNTVFKGYETNNNSCWFRHK